MAQALRGAAGGLQPGGTRLALPLLNSLPML